MIRSKPATDVYRDAWDRVFGDPELVFKFYGGSLDGQTRANVRGMRCVVPLPDGRTRETYVRDRERFEYDEHHVPTVIAYKLETVEKCTKAAGHEDACQYEVVT